MEILFLAGFVLWVLWSVGNLSKTTAYVNPRATDKQLDEADRGLSNFWGVLLVLFVLFVLAIGGTFTTGLDGAKLKNNAEWVWSGEGDYRR